MIISHRQWFLLQFSSLGNSSNKMYGLQPHTPKHTYHMHINLKTYSHETLKFQYINTCTISNKHLLPITMYFLNINDVIKKVFICDDTSRAVSCIISHYLRFEVYYLNRLQMQH